MTITKNIFVASRMANPMRKKIRNFIDEINNDFINNSIDFRYEVFIFPEDPTENAGDANTQATINDRITTSDIFILLVEDGKQLGAISYQELMLAHDTESQSAKSILCYVIRKDGSVVSQTTCDMGNNEQCTIDQAMNECGNRYAYYVKDSSFKDYLCGFLKSIVTGARFKQSELNYTYYIHTKPNQNFRTEPLYFRRDIDEEITNVLNKSSLIVLEGQSYCGKTRAAFNLMINNEQWADHFFYIIQGDHADALSRINNINILTQTSTVVLIDDINLAIGSNDLQSIKPNSFIYNLKTLRNIAPSWKKLTVIITISGKSDATETNGLYSKLFGDTRSQLLNDIRVNFNTNLTRQKFNKLVSELRREGLITDPRIYPGNYTIGSLFINEQELNDKIANATKDGGDIFFHTLKSFSLVKKDIKCNTPENDKKKLEKIFDIVHKRLSRPKGPNNFDSFLKKSHSDGLVFVEYDQNNIITAINIDTLVLDKFNFIYNRIDAIKDLIDSETSLANQNMILQYGFWVLSYNELTKDETTKLITHICQKFKTTKSSPLVLKKECQQLQHLDIFCTTALAEQVFNDWTLLDKLPTKDKNLYKDTLVALLHENRKLSKIQKENVLNKIFSDKVCIFSDDDLKSNIFALKRLSVHFIKKGIYTTSQILDFAENATIANCQSDACDDSDFDPFETSDNSSSNSTNNDDGFLLIQIGKVIHELLKTTSDYTEFEKVFDEINKFDDESKIKQATQTSFFDKNLHYLLVGIAKKYPYSDKYKLFNHILSKSPALSPHLKTVTLNKFLPLLDEHDALSAFNEMIGKNIFDKYTLPFLFKNRLLGFEQLLSIVNDEDYKDLAHFITLNQLLDKADTQSDAISCFRLMGVKDLKPENLKDESALGSYLKIKDVTAKESIEVLKAFKINNKYAEKNKCISQSTLGKIIQKPDFDFDSLYKLLFNDIANNEVIELLGLSEEEAKATRHNQYCYNFLYKKNKQLDKSTADDIFNKTPKDLIYNDEKSSIIAEYTKNRQVFLDYTGLKMFFDNQPPEFKHTEYTYNRLLYLAVKSQSDSIDIKIKNVNSLLIEAYNYFADKFPEEEVIEKMAYLYHLRLKLVTENDFDKVINYPYEGQIIEASFKGYLEHILKNEPRYANDTFIFRILKSMRKEVNNDIYNLAQKFATINRVGITIDSLNPKTNNLSETVINHIVDTSKGIKIDECIIADYSPIKMLWWLLEKGRTTIEEAEKYRKSKNIDITQTYLNVIFNHLAKADSNLRHLKKKNQTEYQQKLIDCLEEMKRHLKYLKNKSIYFSIQMAIAMLKTAKEIIDENHWTETTSIIPETIYNNSSEILDLKISRLTPDSKDNIIDRWNSIVTLLAKHQNIVNITNINSCLSILNHIKFGLDDTSEINDPDLTNIINSANDVLNYLWPGDNLKFDINKLINSSNLTIGHSTNNCKLIDVDVRTFIYYSSKKEIFQIIKEQFDNNMYYEKRKDCLKDFLRNLSRAINSDLIKFDDIKDDISVLIGKNKKLAEKYINDEHIIDKIIYIIKLNSITNEKD